MIFFVLFALGVLFLLLRPLIWKRNALDQLDALDRFEACGAVLLSIGLFVGNPDWVTGTLAFLALLWCMLPGKKPQQIFSAALGVLCLGVLWLQLMPFLDASNSLNFYQYIFG
ncbi:MAG: hypothetical protein JKY15_03210 [Deltaproteobacteria bacterium]|nr:hypothetical protein [Deltaproteobacteria bacterium]